MNSCLSTGLITASAVVSDHKDYLNGVLITTDGTNAATVIVYDNASAASGKILAKGVVAGATNQFHIAYHRGLQASNGLYVSIAGTGAGAQVYFGAAG